MVMPKDAWASMWGGRERELVVAGWRLRRIPRPAQQKAETREYKTESGLDTRTLHLWDWLSLLPWPMGRICAEIVILSAQDRRVGVALESHDW